MALQILSGNPDVAMAAAATADWLVWSSGVLLYVGPDQLMPLASIFGAIAGVALMFWNKIVGLTARGWRALRGRPEPPAAPPEHTPVE